MQTGEGGITLVKDKELETGPKTRSHPDTSAFSKPVWKPCNTEVIPPVTSVVLWSQGHGSPNDRAKRGFAAISGVPPPSLHQQGRECNTGHREENHKKSYKIKKARRRKKKKK